MNLKSQLKFYLDLRGLSASELARKSGVSKQVISLWLTGSKPKNVDQAKHVADTLKISLDNLLFGKGEDIHEKKHTELSALLGDEWVSGVFEVKLRRVRK